jgi:hypothetical protein
VVSVAPDIVITLTLFHYLFHYLRTRIRMGVNYGTLEFYILIYKNLHEYSFHDWTRRACVPPVHILLRHGFI